MVIEVVVCVSSLGSAAVVGSIVVCVSSLSFLAIVGQL